MAVPQIDVTRLNEAVERLLATTVQPRHRFLLMTYARQRLLEAAGRHEELFAATEMSEEPSYHLRILGGASSGTGRGPVARLYQDWAATGCCVTWREGEQIAVADNFVASTAYVHRFAPGAVLARHGVAVDDPAAMYRYTAPEESSWLYDTRGRLAGQDVWEVDPARAVVTRCEPGEVITLDRSAAALAPLIRPLPAYDDFLRGAADLRATPRREAAK